MSDEMYSVVNGVKTDRWIHAEILGENFDDVPVRQPKVRETSKE